MLFSGDKVTGLEAGGILSKKKLDLKRSEFDRVFEHRILKIATGSWIKYIISEEKNLKQCNCIILIIDVANWLLWKDLRGQLNRDYANMRLQMKCTSKSKWPSS